MLGQYYETLVYKEFKSLYAMIALFREGVAPVTKEKFYKWRMALPQRARNSHRAMHLFWIVQKNLNAMRFINDPRNLPSKAAGVGNVKTYCTASVKFVESGN